MPKRPKYKVRSGARRAMHFGVRPKKSFLEFTDILTGATTRTDGFKILDSKYKVKGKIKVNKKK